MSKHMQIAVTVSPYYHQDLADAYPKLARHLEYLNPELVKRNPSLFELAGSLDKLLYEFDSTPLREVLLRHREILHQLHKSIEKDIADWNLAQADKLLYQLEDIFDDIEARLS
jgi:molecular chaperone GrpE (heat shock protein)